MRPLETTAHPTLEPSLKYTVTKEGGLHIIKDPEGNFVQAHTCSVRAVVAWDYLRTRHNDAYWLANGGHYDADGDLVTH